MFFRISLAVMATLLVAGPSVSPAMATPPPPIKLGMSTALTGNASHLGLDVRAGVEAAIAQANATGGIQGRKLELIALDDGYEPSRVSPNMQKLVGDPEILAIIGNVGTPTAVAALPIARDGKIVFFGAYTGAGVLRKTPPEPNVINYRASYAEETAAMVTALVRYASVRPEDVAFFTQRDAYGDAGFDGGLAALRSQGLPEKMLPMHARYERNTDEVEGAVADLMSAATPPKAIIMVGTAAPTAKFVRLARENGVTAIMLSVSFVGSHELATVLGKQGDGVIITQVVPHPDADLPINRDFKAATDSSVHDNFSALEGYIAGRTLCRALQTLKPPPTRANVVSALESLGKFDLGLGVDLELSPTKHQACTHVWPTRLLSGKVQAMNWEDLGRGATVAAPVGDHR